MSDQLPLFDVEQEAGDRIALDDSAEHWSNILTAAFTIHCGTMWGFYRHRDRDEEPCDDCIEAFVEGNRLYDYWSVAWMLPMSKGKPVQTIHAEAYL